MGKQLTSIEINGKRYDARTGKLLSDVAAPTPKTHPVAIRTAAPNKHPHAAAQRSQTLMRSAVRKPGALTAPKPTAKGMVDVARPNVAVQHHPKKMEHAVDPARRARAASVHRSSQIRKFNDLSGANVVHATHRPVTTRIEKMPVATAPKVNNSSAGSAHKTASASIIEQGLRNATSHTQPAHALPAKRNKRARLVSLGAGSLAFLLLGAFILYQNVPNISMRYAAQRAGIAAQLPGYQPSGFALSSKIKYTPGQIEMEFTSNTDDRAFTITQRETNWNSDTLMSNYVVRADSKVQRYEDKGRTIYLYGDSNATWVNAGVWYDIKGNSQLNSDQLIRIATSM